jgi:hypothetical protein
MPVLTDGFELETEKQVTLVVRGTYNSATASYLQLDLINEVTQGSTIVSLVTIESTKPDVAMVCFSLRLDAGKYNWKATMDSRVTDGIIKAKLFRDYFLIHDDVHGGLPPGFIGRMNCRGNNQVYFHFSGLSSRNISVNGVVNGEQKIWGEGGILNIKENKLLKSPPLFALNSLDRGVWTMFSNISIKNKQLYKVVFSGSSSTSKPVSITITLEDTT